MDNLKEFLIWTLVVPALLLSLSVWQGVRAVNGMANDAQHVADLNEDIPALRQIVADSPTAFIRYKQSGVKQSAAKALQESLKRQQYMERIAGQREITLGVAGLGALSSLAVIVAGLIGLWGIREVRRASMRSRAALVQSFSCWQSRLAVVLCVLAGGLCCAVGSAVGFEFWDANLREGFKASNLVGMVKVGIFLFAVFCMGVYAVYKLWKAWRGLFVLHAREMLGQRVTAEACPALWELVRGVAKQAGAQPPDTIVLGMEPTFFVTSGEVDLYPEGERYSGTLLYLSLPFMAYLTREELTSVVAHELGHYAGEDLEYSQRFLPIYIRTHRQLAALHDVETDMESPLSKLALEPATMLARNFFEALDSGVKFWSRQRELAADAVSATVVGSQMAAATLLRVVALSPALDAALELWADVPADADEDPEDMDETSADVDSEQADEPDTEVFPTEVDSEQANEPDTEVLPTEPESSTDPLHLVHLAAGPDGVLTFVRQVLRGLREGEGQDEEDAESRPLLTNPREVLETAVPHPLDTHPLTAQRLQNWGVDVDEVLALQAMRLEESSLLLDLGLEKSAMPAPSC